MTRREPCQNPAPELKIRRIMQIWHLKNCGTCKEAVKTLRDRAPKLTEVRDEGVSRADMQRFLDLVGAEKLVNKSSLPWQNMTGSGRAGDPLTLLMAHPTLMKRPVIEDGDTITAGWTPAIRAIWGV